jgi:E3 ubiquitin-protein ligase HUWE1
MELVLAEHTLPEEKQIKLFTHLRLAYAFPSFDQRLLCIQARLQALSILGKHNMYIYNYLLISLSDSLFCGNTRNK